VRGPGRQSTQRKTYQVGGGEKRPGEEDSRHKKKQSPGENRRKAGSETLKNGGGKIPGKVDRRKRIKDNRKKQRERGNSFPSNKQKSTFSY